MVDSSFAPCLGFPSMLTSWPSGTSLRIPKDQAMSFPLVQPRHTAEPVLAFRAKPVQ